MTTEEKDLLRKDLCARLAYGVIVSVTDGTIKFNAYVESVSYKNIQVSPVSDSNFTAYAFYKISEIKPYLRPMSSMTKEEKNEHFGRTMTIDIVQTSKEVIEWLLERHFDFRGLIEKGLAIAVTEENNPYKS